MTIEQYIKRLTDIQKEHPGTYVIITDDDGNAIYVEPEWSKRDDVVYADGPLQ